MSRLLIADDDRELFVLLAERMRAEGFQLDAAHDGRKGLELASSGSYALVILDIMMPRLGGMDVLKLLRMKSAVPVLMLTAKGDDIDRIPGLELGADDYLPKPFNPRELMARIRAILRRVEEQFSKDPQFVEKVRDIVGLFMNPPDRAMVLCVDEKSQVQA